MLGGRFASRREGTGVMAGDVKARRPSSALSRIPKASLNHPLHPQETLGRGYGSNIAVDPASVELLADRQLARKTLALVETLESRPPPDPLLAELRRELEEEQTNEQAWQDDDNDDDDDDDLGAQKVKNITDLRPSEMARLEHRFKGGSGLVRQDFEAVMREFTGMEGKMGGQLFCKIDANDDGTVEWDEFLEYIVQEAGAKLEASKHKAGCSLAAAHAPTLFCQPKDMVGAQVLCSKQRILASVGMVRREVVFWNADTLTKVGEALMPTISQLDSRRPFTVTNSVASRSMAYLPSTLGSVYVCSGTETMILQYDCRRFRVQRHLFTSTIPSSLRTAWNPSVTRTATNIEQGSWLLVGDVAGDVTAYNCKTLEQVGKYQAHTAGLQDAAGSLVTDIVFWPRIGGVVSCGDDGRVVVADCHFWKVKDYFTSEKLQTVEMVVQIVTDARRQLDMVSKAEQHAGSLQVKLASEEAKLEKARRADEHGKSNRALPDLMKTVEGLREQSLAGTRAVSHRKIAAAESTRLAMELLGGSGSLSRGMVAEWERRHRIEEAAVAAVMPDGGVGGEEKEAALRDKSSPPRKGTSASILGDRVASGGVEGGDERQEGAGEGQGNIGVGGRRRRTRREMRACWINR